MKRPIDVLILEDSEDDFLLLTRHLKKSGLSINAHRADCAAEMTAFLRDKEWDIILSDHNMLNFSSTEALELLRRTDRDIPFVIVSGTIGEHAAVNAMKSGAHDYVLKNNLSRLSTVVEREIREAEVRSENRKLQSELIKVYERYALVINTTNDVIWEWNIATNETWFNDNMRSHFGHDAESATLDHDWFLEKVHPEDRSRIQPRFRNAARDGKTSVQGEYRFRRHDGSYAYIFDRLNIIYDHEKKPSRVLGMMVDISEKKLLEEQFIQSQKMEMVGRLAGGVAHDFNNLLSVIGGHAEFLLRDDYPPHRRDESVKQIKRSVDRASALTRQLLAFTRKAVYQPKVVCLNDIVQEMQNLMERLMREDIDIATKVDPRAGNIAADPTHIEQALMNLIVNARDAIPGSGQVTVETRNMELDHTYSATHLAVKPGHYVMLAVTDTGTGIDEATRAKIFTPFFTTKGPGKGTGLGLATVYGIVKEAGGSIQVYSEPGKGTTFKLYFPRVDRPVELKSSVQNRPIPRGNETVLVVEDDEQLRSVTRAILELHGYHVIAASNSTDAVRLSKDRKVPIHLLITDVVMPGLNGRELSHVLVMQRRDLRVLYVSGYPDDAVFRHSVLEKDLAFLQKPFTTENLARKVREVLDK